MEMDNESKMLIVNKDYKMTKIRKNTYLFEYEIENNNILLCKILDFEFIKLIHEINKHDIFEDFDLEIKNDSRAVVFILFKHFYADFGVSQKYTHLNVSIDKTPTQIVYKASTNEDVPKNREAEIMPVKDVTVICDLITPHKVSIKTTTEFDNNHLMIDLPEFIEKLASTIISKIFLRTKQFIEKIYINNIN
jgi:hypothetical protein